MNWYYVENGVQKGPLNSDQDLDALFQQGTIRAETMIWREGMAGWEPYSQVRAGTPGATTTPSAGDVVCSECGKVFPPDQVIRHGTAYVCANCKPIFVQKLREGAVLPGTMRYASVWTRFAAIFVDGIILWIVNLGFGIAAGVGVSRAIGLERGDFGIRELVLLAVQMAVGFGYEGVMIGKYGATLGKMAVRVRVVTSDGERLTYGRSFGRYFSKILSSIICGIGFIMAAFDGEKRTLHDRICNTRVVRI